MNILTPFCLERLHAAGLVLCLLTAAPLCAAPIKFIAVSATAASGYVRPVDAQGKPRPESYVFTEGKYFEGQTADAHLAQVRFEDIIKTLAPSLAKQNYFPTKDVPAADLLIMVHWGTTTVYEDPDRAFQVEKQNEALNQYRTSAEGNNGQADPGALNQALGDQANALSSTQASIARNSALLGYKPDLEREQRRIFASTDEQTMNAELNEERYFVILMAYDFQRMKREHKSHILWVTRISVRSPGNKFTEAMPALINAGADVYGRQLDGLVRVNGRTRDGRVELGEMKVIGTVPDAKLDAPQK